MGIKEKLSNIKFSNFKNNWEKARSDPYISAKMNYNFTKWLVWGLMLIIGFTFIKLILTVNGGSSALTLLLRGAMVVVGLMIMSKIYFTVLNPMKKTLEHYEATPSTQTSHYVDTNKEIDEIFDHFEKKEVKK